MDHLKKIFVGSLPWAIDSDALAEIFAQYGEIVEAVIVKDRDTGRSKGFGFVTFTTEEAAKAATQMDGRDVDGRTIVVNISRPREERPRR